MFTPRQCGVKFDPPTLVLYYVVKSSGKVHRRSMPLRNFTASTSIEETVDNLKSGKHQRYLENIPNEQLHRLLSKIQEKLESSKETKIEAGDGNKGLESEDFNKLSDTELDKKKAEMDKVFEKNRVKPGDDGFKYEVEVDFEGGNKISGWDSEDYSDPEF